MWDELEKCTRCHSTWGCRWALDNSREAILMSVYKAGCCRYIYKMGKFSHHWESESLFNSVWIIRIPSRRKFTLVSLYLFRFVHLITSWYLLTTPLGVATFKNHPILRDLVHLSFHISFGVTDLGWTRLILAGLSLLFAGGYRLWIGWSRMASMEITLLSSTWSLILQ